MMGPSDTPLSQALDGTDGQDHALEKGCFRVGGTVPTALCLMKAAIGAGILSLSSHAAVVGFIYQQVGLVIGFLLTMKSIHFCAKASTATGRFSFEDISEELFHPAVSYFTGLMNSANCMGAAAAYLISAKTVFQMLHGASDLTDNEVLVMLGVICAPLSLAKEVSFMRHLAALGVAGLVFLVAVVVWMAFRSDPGQRGPITEYQFLWGNGEASVFAYMTCLNTFVFAYCNQFNVPQLTGELTPAPSSRSMLRAAALGVGMSLGLYSCVSVSGVLAFGVGSQQNKDGLIADLEIYKGSPMVFISICAALLSVLICFQFVLFPIRQFAAFTVRRARGFSGKETEDRVCFGLSVTRWFDVAAALTSVALIVCVAVAVPSLESLVSIVGALAGGYISYIIPPLWMIQVGRKQEGFTWWKLETLGCIAMCCVGIFLLTFGTYAALQS